MRASAFFSGVFSFVVFVCSFVKHTDYNLASYCLAQPRINKLCMSAGVIYPDYNDSVESVGNIRELLLDETEDPWVMLVGEQEWVKLEKVGSIFRNTRPGTPFEARRYGAPLGAELEIFHICRTKDCGFLAPNSKVPEYLGADNRPRDTHHVARFAFTDKAAPVAPGVALPGPEEIVKVFKSPKKLIAGLVVTAWLFLVRLKQVLANVDISKSISDGTAYLLRGVIGNLVFGACAFESGIIGGLTTFYRDDYPHECYG